MLPLLVHFLEFVPGLVVLLIYRLLSVTPKFFPRVIPFFKLLIGLAQTLLDLHHLLLI